MNTTQEELRRLAEALDIDLGNFSGMASVFPDYQAPVLRLDANGNRRLEMMRWGFPPVGPNPSYVTNVRNLSSNFWKGWLKPEWRVVVPATSFSEYLPTPDPVTKKRPVAWFAMKDGSSAARPAFGFAGIWRPWTGARGTKADRIEGEHKLFSFLTTEPNSIVKPIHDKAMPVILRPDKWQAWLTTPDPIAMQLPLPDGQLHVARVGPKGDSDDLQAPYDAEYQRLAGSSASTALLT
ncbi:putative SOS response-associated peptidase YedK [Inquilinus ginsengisoli]|uniref:Abasic site processing protein n=1 Tax=Inquilinus ginsengisoli TaxID=363840 RepID=A0ABU1K3B2_9PROT|nr:putative SOS response-associated peptidase YedK [Inquilinus ginsengisoli]